MVPNKHIVPEQYLLMFTNPETEKTPYITGFLVSCVGWI